MYIQPCTVNNIFVSGDARKAKNFEKKGAQYLLFKHVQENISKTSFENSVLVKNDLIHGKHKQKERARERGARDIVVTTWRLNAVTLAI